MLVYYGEDSLGFLFLKFVVLVLHHVQLEFAEGEKTHSHPGAESTAAGQDFINKEVHRERARFYQNSGWLG